MIWTAADEQAAYHEGWGIFRYEASYQLQRIDEPDDDTLPAFDNDEQVWKAIWPSPTQLHRRARAFLREHAPDEVQVIEHWLTIMGIPLREDETSEFLARQERRPLVGKMHRQRIQQILGGIRE